MLMPVHRQAPFRFGARFMTISTFMSIKTHFSLLFFFCSGFSISSAQKVSIDSTLIGVWKGTSICQIKNSPCHDENVVYHISKGHGIDTFKIVATKIVNGKEEEMGTLGFKFNKKTNQLISTDYGLWTFNLKGNKLEGTLIVRGDLYRIIKVSK